MRRRTYTYLLLIALLGAVGAATQEVAVPEWLRGVELRPAYTEGAGLVFDHRCSQCHRDGGLGPMSFETLGNIREWSVGTQMPMEDAIALRLMPPWPADPTVGDFANDSRLTEPEIEALEAWIEAGYPRGDGSYEPWSDWHEEWSIGEPDMTWDLPEQTVAAGASNVVVEHVIQMDLPVAHWVIAAEAMPGDARIVTSIDAGPLGQYRAMNSATRFAPGHAMRLNERSEITVRVRYDNPTNEVRTDRSRLGIVFPNESADIHTQLRRDPMRAEPFTLASEAKDHEVRVRFTFPRPGRIHELMPVMQLRGMSVEYTLLRRDGRSQRLLSIPEWSPLWQFRYQLRRPVVVAAGDVVEAVAIYDNSFDNIRNPDPWSDMDSEETGDTFEGWLTYALAVIR